MSVDREKRTEAESIVLPALKKALASFENKDVFDDDEFPDLSPHTRDINNFSYLTSLALAAYQLNANPKAWFSKVERFRQELKQNFVEFDKLVEAAEIDIEYCLYLADIKKYDEAMDMALHLTDEYFLLALELEPIEASMLEDKKPNAIMLLVYKLIKVGEIARAKNLVTNIELKPFQAIGYYNTLLDHLIKVDNPEEVKELLVVMSGNTKLIQFYQNKNREALDRLFDRAEKFLYEPESDAQNLTEPSTKAAEYEGLSLRLERKVKLIELLLKVGGEEEDHKEIRQIFFEILDELSLNTDERDFDNYDANSSVGSLDFTAKNMNQPERKPLTQFDRVATLLDLGFIFAQYPQVSDLFDICIYGQNDKDSLVNSIDRCESNLKFSLWCQLMRVFGANQDIATLEECYELGCKLYPKYKVSLDRVFIEELFRLDPSRAYKLIQAEPDFSLKIDLLSKFILKRFSNGESFLKWPNYIDELCELENQILGKKNEPGFSMSDFSKIIAGYDSDKDPDSIEAEFDDDLPFQPPFLRKSEALLAQLAVVAIQRGEWEGFSQILGDPRLVSQYKAGVITRVTNWLIKGTTLSN